MIDGPINDDDMWRTRYSNELDTLCDDLDIVKMIKIGTLNVAETAL